MNFLQIAQRLRQESGITSSVEASPTTVVSQIGKLKKVVDWAAESYNTIQRSASEWRWLRSTFTIPTVAGTDTYAYTAATDVGTAATITRFSRWIPKDDFGDSNLTCYLTSAGVSGEQYLTFLPWAAFRARYKFGTQTNGTPIYFTIDPQNQIVLGPKPNAVYTISGEYQKSAQTLALDADTPEMPADYHMLIVWEALKNGYAGYEGAPEVFTRAHMNATPIHTALSRSQLPQLSFGGALA